MFRELITGGIQALFIVFDAGMRTTQLFLTVNAYFLCLICEYLICLNISHKTDYFYYELLLFHRFLNAKRGADRAIDLEHDPTVPRDGIVCPICLRKLGGEWKSLAMISCYHVICERCARDSLVQCPVCREPCERKQILYFS